MRKIEISNNKCLKLVNIIEKNIDIQEEKIELEVKKMINYIQNKGAKPIGPIIQYAGIASKNEVYEPFVIMMMQADKYIHNVDQDYKVTSQITVRNCLYARYQGEEGMLQVAYDKLNVYAFENNINLCGKSYTIHISQNQDDTIIADVFMERAD